MAFTWDTNVPLLTVFKEKIYVPDYQRDYAWGEEQASDFIDDLIDFTKTKSNNDESYLLGQFIFYKDENDRFVIDGQQRIITTVIFMSVVRNLVDKLTINARSPDVTTFYSNIYTIIGREDKGDFKLTVKGSGKTYFEKHILRSEEPTKHARWKSTRNMFTVYCLFKNRLTEYIKECNSDQESFEKLNELTDNLVNNFLVSTISTGDMAKAYTIFETLNSRGMDLEPADLLKNYLFQKSGIYEEIIKNQWSEVDNALDEAKESVTHLLRSYWNSYHETTRTKLLYRSISKNIKTSEDAREFVDGLEKVYIAYLSMRKPEEYRHYTSSEIKKELIGLKLLDVKLYYPMILACVKVDASEDEVYSLLDSIETLIVRNIIFGPDNANKFENLFSSLACKITNGSSINSIVSEIKTKTINDEQFESYFKHGKIKEAAVSRYILSEIYNMENRNEIVINPDSSEVNLEHIMPQNNSIWNVPQEEHDSFVYYLGNQTLLLKSDNTSASNESFSQKKIVYSRSTLTQNSEIASIETWNKASIEFRQMRLFKTAIKRWKLN